MTDDRPVDTWHVPVHFKPRGHASGEPWILIERLEGPDLPILEVYGGWLGMELMDPRPAKTLEVANFLDQNIRFLTYTGPIRPEYAELIDIPSGLERPRP